MENLGCVRRRPNHSFLEPTNLILAPAPNAAVTLFHDPRIVNLVQPPVNVTLLWEPAIRAEPPAQSNVVVWWAERNVADEGVGTDARPSQQQLPRYVSNATTGSTGCAEMRITLRLSFRRLLQARSAASAAMSHAVSD